MSTPSPTRDLTIDSAIDELRLLKAEKTVIEGRIADLEKIITAEATAGEYVTSDNIKFRITIPKTLDKKALEADFPRDHAEENEQLYKTKHEFDITAAKKIFDEETLEEYYKDGKAQVRL